ARRREGDMRDGCGSPDHAVPLVPEVVDDRTAASADVGDGEVVGPPRRSHRSYRAVDRRVLDSVAVDDVQHEAMSGVDDVRDPVAVRGPGNGDDASAGGMRPRLAAGGLHCDKRVSDARGDVERVWREGRSTDG